MCGITGYININNKPINDTSRIIQMLKVQKHRGPDDSGIRAFSLGSGLSEELATNEPKTIQGEYEGLLGFNRLSILDLSMNGHQPMLSPNKKVILAFNGEIYNAFDFKAELEQSGYKFKSTTDTEIVLALYLRYGFEGMLLRLNGMFAIVIIDLGRKEIFITRDRFGIKPMYYIEAGGTLAFSSELKSFKHLEGFHFRLDVAQLDEYMLFRNNLRGTLFKDIKSLEPGHYLLYSQEKGLTRKRYFNINDYRRSLDKTGDLNAYSKQLEDWLNKSVQSQLMSDVKLGCQLSGGIDSSLVTWFANGNSQKGNFESVSIIFDDSRFSEEKYINMVRDKFKIQAHKFLLNSDYYLDNIESATWHLEFPINHPNTIGIYKLSQRAKDYVTVLLSGEGADEVFGGYGWFYDISFPFRGRRLLSEFKKNIHNPVKIFDYLNPSYRSIMATSFMKPELAGKIYSEFSIDRALSERKELYSKLSGSVFDRQVKYEMQVYMPDLLIRQDKMSMAHSIENRVPFLDNEVVENSFGIPERFLLPRKGRKGHNTEKYLLKKMAAKTFGEEFAFRNKMGFGIPLKEFFVDDEFYEYLVNQVLPAIKDRGIFNHKLVYAWLADINGLKYFELEALWVIISFEIWASIYLDADYENRNTSH